MKKTIIMQHGHSKPQSNSSKISGHMYNPVAGTIDTFVDGEFSHHLCQLHDPKPELARKAFVVGTETKLNLNYNSGLTEWKLNQFAIIYSKGK